MDEQTREKMTGFHFGVPIEICGKTYYIDLNRTGVKAKINELNDQIEEAVKAANTPKGLKEVMDLTKSYINTILGDGAFETIFAGREGNAYDLVAFYKYVAAVVNAEKNRINEERKKAAAQ